MPTRDDWYPIILCASYVAAFALGGLCVAGLWLL